MNYIVSVRPLGAKHRPIPVSGPLSSSEEVNNFAMRLLIDPLYKNQLVYVGKVGEEPILWVDYQKYA